MSRTNDTKRRRSLGTAFPTGWRFSQSFSCVCVYCGGENWDELDHMFPLEWASVYVELTGNEWESFSTKANCAPACNACHAEKTSEQRAIRPLNARAMVRHYNAWKAQVEATKSVDEKLARKINDAKRKYKIAKRNLTFATKEEFGEWDAAQHKKIAAMRRMK